MLGALILLCRLLRVLLNPLDEALAGSSFLPLPVMFFVCLDDYRHSFTL